MGLSCKTGTYNRVFSKLLDLNIPRRDIFLLFGPIDMLVQFEDFKNFVLNNPMFRNSIVNAFEEYVELWNHSNPADKINDYKLPGNCLLHV